MKKRLWMTFIFVGLIASVGSAKLIAEEDRSFAVKNPLALVDSHKGVVLKTGVAAHSEGDIAVTEGTIDIEFTLPHPAKTIWPKMKDFNQWQNGYGFYYDRVVGDEENGNLVYLSKKPNNRGVGGAYTVRKVIPEHLIYLDSVPSPTFSGHNIFHLTENNGITTINVYMEHTWRLPGKTEAEARTFAKTAVGRATKFWQEHFIPDLRTLVNNGK
ncbi:hypothetical protein OAE19_09765 [Porticoccaceae bacterium]|nr:hypothetical protein [Porticoccaceae bacterium]